MDSTVQTVLLSALLFTAWSNRITVHCVVKLYYCSPSGQIVLLFITFFFLFLINFQQRLRIGEKSQSWQA